MISTIVAASTFAGLAAAAPVANIFATAAESVTTFGPFNATHFYSTEYQGSCGYTNRTNQYIVSIATNKTSESACGKTVNITSQWNGESVLAQVVDERVNASSSYLNLSRVAFEAVAPISYEYFGATYTFSDKDVPAYVPVAEANGDAPSQPEASPEKDDSPSTWTSTSSSKKAEWTPTTSSSEKAEWTPTSSSSKSQWTPSTSSSAKWTPEQKEEWTPSSSSKQAQQTQQQQQQESKPQSSGGQSGSVTYFYQGGNAGACGNVNSDSSYVAALSPSQYSGRCGQSVTITNTANGNTITATVADLCPSCAYGHIDLSVGAFQALGSMSSGVLQTTYYFN